MNKKGQALDNIKSAVMGFVVLGVVLAIGIFILSEMQTAVNDEGIGVTTSAGTDELALYSVAYQNIVTSDTTKFNSWTSIIPNATFTAEFTQTETAFATNVWYLRLRGVLNTTINTSQIQVKNASTVLPATNYTVSQISTDVVMINVTETTYGLNNLTFVYNRTFNASDDLSDTSLCYLTADCPMINTTGSSAYSSNYTLRLGSLSETDISNLNNTVWDITWSESERDVGINSSAAGDAIGGIVTKMATAPTWIGLLIVIIFASAILGYFYFKP